ncbi:NifB/NifX family molybdenum-iron cluster-binding protein [Blastopirellula sp. JC732]|uniref:NifB/NifX family molybdenum-iron cluster-binding protein n=1 Tax=Blastopirellula sediminis TaxID=2894196 RepID=A0A9X1MKH5_9BACT|nr:NifB/NifX family molybdenum-iron cluster-binding protein [Blastopirellula sediminis]MCC9608415.1 NifB/NifX family molybdenum-iron cluster-binding protein [Blastopirellula sediminis]MCC9628808.1 NifB/NifX family molybdenum-iron cluster-binding protein [Blastopirellula sediminis]
MTIKRHIKLINSESDSWQETEMEIPALRVALASSDGVHVDEHFGSASQLVIYRVDGSSAQLISVASFSDMKQDGNENKLTEKFTALEGTHAVFALAVGASAVRQLVALGTQPIKLGEKADVNEVLYYLREEIRNGQTPWINKALNPPIKSSEERLEALLGESWDE